MIYNFYESDVKLKYYEPSDYRRIGLRHEKNQWLKWGCVH